MINNITIINIMFDILYIKENNSIHTQEVHDDAITWKKCVESKMEIYEPFAMVINVAECRSNILFKRNIFINIHIDKM